MKPEFSKELQSNSISSKKKKKEGTLKKMNPIKKKKKNLNGEIYFFFNYIK